MRAGFLRGRLLDLGGERVAVLQPPRAAGEARVVEQVGTADRTTECVEQLVVGRADGEPAIRGAQRLVGRAQSMGGAERLRRAAGGPVLGGLPDGERHRRLEQRRVDELPFARRLAMLERAEHAVGAEEPGGKVADGNPGLRRRAVLLAGDADDATHALRDEVVAAA